MAELRLGGTTYTALASLFLAPRDSTDPPITSAERQSTVRWLLSNQLESGGFSGRTGKEADACYCFWCGAALQVFFVGISFLSRADYKINTDSGRKTPCQCDSHGKIFVKMPI